MRLLLQNGVHVHFQSKLPSHLTRRPTSTSPRSPLHRHQQRNKSSDPSKNPPAEPAKDNASSNSSQLPPNPKSSAPLPPPPPPGSVASSAGAPTPPVSTATGSGSVSGSRSFTQIIQAGPVGRAGRSYSRVQERRPYLTQVCSSIVVYLCADLSAQILFPSEPAKSEENGEEGNEDGEKEIGGGGGWYDPARTLRHLTVGVVSSIPSYNWFMFLHNNFNFTSKPLSILTKVLIQQLIFTPVFNTYFFSVHSLLAGASAEETLERLKVALPVSFTNSAKLWPAITAFSFMYVPAQFRSVFAGCIAVGWQTYLSWLNQKAAREVELEEWGCESESESERERSTEVGATSGVVATA